MSKLTKTQLKAITEKAAKLRQAGGIKSKKTVTVTVYKKKWTACIAEATKSLGLNKAHKSPRQTSMKLK